MNFTYRYVVNGKEGDDYHWITLKEMQEHPNEEQFVGCLYELVVTYTGESVMECGSVVIQDDDLLKRL